MKWSELRGELWARAVLTGICQRTYWSRIHRRGMTPEQAVDTPIDASARLRREHIEGLLVPRDLYRERIRYGWSHERAATAPRGVVTPTDRVVSADLARLRIAKGMDPALARTAPPHSLPRANASRWDRLTQSEREGALALGITETMFRDRVGNRWTPEEALSVPPRQWRRKTVRGGQ